MKDAVKCKECGQVIMDVRENGTVKVTSCICMIDKSMLLSAAQPILKENTRSALRETIDIIHPGSSSGKITRYVDEIKKELHKSLGVSKDLFDK